MIEAIWGIFTKPKKREILLLQRGPSRTHNPKKWDLMGGDIMPGESPQETLLDDAVHKLRVRVVTIHPIGTFVVEGSTPVKRHLFVCEGDYSNMVLESKKYSLHMWCRLDKISQVENLAPGVKELLAAIDPFNDIS